MDKKHQLDAPNNESLRTIEQIEDRTTLAAVYPHAQNEWEGIDLMSGEARAKKQAAEQVRINLSIRKWFPIIGLLVVLPFVLLAFMLTIAATYLRMEDAGFLLLPVFFGITVWGYLSYKSIRWVYSIFYNHSIKATPYVIAHLLLLGIGFQGLFLYAQTFHNGWTIGDVLVVSGIIIGASIILSALLLFIWTSRKISSRLKFALIATLGLIIAGAQVVHAILK